MTEEQNSPNKMAKLDADQFQISDQGELIIQQDQLSNIIDTQRDHEGPSEAGGVSVGVSVT